ncbi:DMT family transporter [Afipia carboxidovorans]|uniref:DMT family transporter n=1 Tax=Afipia carboxidovorans TaxID=40137 RepID=UPI003085936C|nr:DMT family transporter [Afipia carboxidovorans]
MPPPKTFLSTLGLMQRPYLTLCLAMMFWAGNVVIGRHAAGVFPPMALSYLRWLFAFLTILPFAWSDLKADWPIIRRHFGLVLVLSVTGVATFNTLGYWSLQYTTALNGLLLQSSGPLYVALFALVLFNVRLTWGQALGIAISLIGVLTIILQGDFSALLRIEFNKGDIGYTVALFIFGLYSAVAARRPPMKPLALIAASFGIGSLFILPLFILEMWSGRVTPINAHTIPILIYVSIFPSTLSYMFYNRGVELIGANRAAPFLHLIPVFGSVMAIGFLGETLHLYHMVGYALVFAGVVLAARKPKTT